MVWGLFWRFFIMGGKMYFKFPIYINFSIFIVKHQSQLLMMNWTPQEENMLKTLKESAENMSWSTISKHLRKIFEDKYHTAKQCRERYINYVRFQRNDEKFLKWTKEEENLLYDLYEKIGSNWNNIGESFDFKSENTIKNKFYGSLRKLLRRLNSIGKSTRKLRKQLRYESLIRPLQISKSLTRDTELSQMALSLRKKLIEFLRTNFEILTEEAAINFIQNVNKFNLMSRSMSRKKIRRECQVETAEGPKNRKKNEEENEEEDEVSFDKHCKVEERAQEDVQVKIEGSQKEENFGMKELQGLPIKRENNIILQGIWRINTQDSYQMINRNIPYPFGFNCLPYGGSLLNMLRMNDYQESAPIFSYSDSQNYLYEATQPSIQHPSSSSFTRLKRQD